VSITNAETLNIGIIPEERIAEIFSRFKHCERLCDFFRIWENPQRLKVNAALGCQKPVQIA